MGTMAEGVHAATRRPAVGNAAPLGAGGDEVAERERGGW
jgi:hypothetical protein